MPNQEERLRGAMQEATEILKQAFEQNATEQDAESRTNLTTIPTAEWLDPRQAGEYLNRSPSTLAKQRLDGSGPPYAKWGRLIRYQRKELDEYLIARIRRSTSQEAENAS